MLKVYRHISEALTLQSAEKKDGRNLLADDLSIIKNAAIVCDDSKIIWVGPDDNLEEKYKRIPSINLTGKVITPALVDSHTHIVFAGNRANEYADRLNGVDYQLIANRGGGILFTMSQTRKATRSELFDLAKKRIETLMSYGVKTIEIKSGYALNYDKEKELSEIIFDLKNYFKKLNILIFNTFLAAHAIPTEYKNSEAYLDSVVLPLLTDLAKRKIIDAVDIFHEQKYFTTSDTEKLFKHAHTLNIPVKIHADEFNDNKGAILATKYNALSADHLLCTGKDGILALANSKTVATLLPGTGFFLGKNQANARAFLDSGVKVALASDFNPGSCHCDNLLLLASISGPQYKMNLAEIWSAITLNASHALGLKNQGAIIPGFDAKFSIFDCETVSEITYNWGKNLYSKVF
jgi:imidazolonepropionase